MELFKERITNQDMSDNQSDQSKMPAAPLRGWLHDMMKEQGDEWPQYLRVTLHEGVLRVDSVLPEVRPAEWATVRSGAIGEIGFVIDEHAKERVVWRPAWGYALSGDADDAQPWRAARNGRDAMALLLEGIHRQLQPAREGWCYETLIEMAGQSTDVRYRDTHSRALYAVMNKIRSCLNHRNAVRQAVGEALRYYDPGCDAFAAGTLARHVPRWTAKRFQVMPIKEVSGAAHTQNGSEIWASQTKVWDGDADLPVDEFIRYENVTQCSHAFAYGKRVPGYVREAMEASNAQATFVPLVTRKERPELLSRMAEIAEREYAVTEPPPGFASGDNQLCWDFVPPPPDPEYTSAVVIVAGVPRVRSVERSEVEPDWERVERIPVRFDAPDLDALELAGVGDDGSW